PQLMKDNQTTGDRSKRLWREQPKGNDHLHKMTEQHAEAMHEARKMVEVPAQWIGKRLCFIVVEEAGQLSPAAGVTQVGQARAQPGSKEHPAKSQNGNQ